MSSPAATTPDPEEAMARAEECMSSPTPARTREAIRLLEGAALDPDRGGRAHLLLGRIYRRGLSGRPDYAKAVAHFQQGAAMSNRNAKAELAFCHMKGQGVDQDLKRALALLEEANKDFGLFDDQVAMLKKRLAEGPVVAQKPPAEDAVLTQRLVGQWRINIKVAGREMGGVTDYRDGGRFHGNFIVGGAATEKKTVEGTWRIEGGQLHCEVMSSNDPVLMPVGLKSRDTIISLDANAFTYRDEEGVVFTERRESSL